MWVASSTVATARFDDGLPRGLGTVVPPESGTTGHSEANLAVGKALESAGVAPTDLDLVELQDNTVFYELAFPEDWGLCQPGEAERLVEKGETLPTGKLPINPSGGFLCFGEATTAMGVFQVCELTWQLREEAGPRQVPGGEDRARADPGPGWQCDRRGAQALAPQRGGVPPDDQGSAATRSSATCWRSSIPIISFTHCKDVAVSVINSGAFAVLGEAMHTPDEIAADIQWIRDRVDGKPFGVDLVLPASVPQTATLDDLMAQIPEEHRSFAKHIKEKYDVPDPKGSIDLHQWGGLNQEMARAQLEVLLDERVPVICSGLGSPAFILDAAHERGIKIFGLIGKTRQAKRQLEAGVDGIIAQGYDAAGHTGAMGTFSIVPEVGSIAGDTPVIAAGGVTTGRHLAAALCLGASGRVDGNPVAGLPRVRRGHDRQGEAAGRHGRRHLLLHAASRA